MRNDFCVFILSNRRPDNIKTLETLERSGYTGKWYIRSENLLRIRILHIGQRRAILVGQNEVAVVDLAQLGSRTSYLIGRCVTGFGFHLI